MKKAWAMLVAVMLLFNLVGMSVFAASEHNIQFKDSGIRVVNQRGTNMSKYFVTSIGEVTTDNLIKHIIFSSIRIRLITQMHPVIISELHFQTRKI